MSAMESLTSADNGVRSCAGDIADHLEAIARSGAIVRHGAGDHRLVITSTGVHVIDATVRSGLVERRFDTSRRDGGFRLLIDGRDRSRLVADVRSRLDDLRARLSRHGVDDIEVFAHLCVAGARWNRLPTAFDVDGVNVTWPSELGRALETPGPLCPERIRALDTTLAT